MAIEHWMTFATFSEQDFFTYPAPAAYHGVILNANMVAHAPAGIAAFLLGKVDPSTCYIIDPMTHAFQHNPETISNENGPKSSIKKLAACYGNFILERLGAAPIDCNVVQDNLEDFTKKVVDFQWSHLESHFTQNGDSKYLEPEEVVRRPSIVVAPYFYLTEDGLEDWLDLMGEAAAHAVQYTAEFAPRPKVYSAIVIERAVLQVDLLIERVVDAFQVGGLDGVLLWVDEFDEVSASSLELMGLAKLCARLRGADLEVLNLHGGYFSCLLASDAFGGGLSGVSHGPEFGESRGVVPVGGGIPISRFYVPDLHLRAKFRDFVPVALSSGWLMDPASFYDNVCGCAACRELIGDDIGNFSLYGESDVKSIKRKHGVVRIEFPTTEAKKRCLRHYLQCKRREYAFVRGATRPEIFADLTVAHQRFSVQDGYPSGSHLQKWKRVLEAI